MSASIRHVNKKQVKIYHFWFCSRCLQKVDMSTLQIIYGIPFNDPNVLSKNLESIGFKLCCKQCNNTTFVKKEFTVQVESMVEKELDKQVKEFTSNNQNPTRRT